MKPESSSTANSVLAMSVSRGTPRKVGVAGDRVDHLLRPVELLEQPQRGARMAVLGVVEVGVALVVEVVDEAGHGPQLLVAAALAGVGDHGRLDPEQVLAQRLGLDPFADQIPGFDRASVAPSAPLLPSAPMEKFVIKGGPPLSGRDHRGRQQERRAADPRRLPAHRGGGGAHQRAADPRHRDPGRGARGARGEGRVDRRRTSCACRPTRSPRRAPDEALSARIRASFLLAGPLLARFGEARMPPPGGDFIGRRRLDPHLDAFTRPRRPGRGRPRDRDPRARRRAEAVRDLHGRAVGDGDRERADGGRADARGRRRSPTPPASPTSRTSPGCWSRWAPQIDGIGSNVMTVHGRDKLGGAEHRDLPRPHRGRELHGARRGDRRASCGSATPSPRT